MTNNRRTSRVSEAIKREVSQMILHGLRDERVGAGMVSITAVDVSGDLQHAKIFVSIFGSDEARAETMEGLKAVTGQVRTLIGQRVRLRRTPEIHFVEDRSFDKAVSVLSLLNKLSQERSTSTLDLDEVPAATD
jgi:ribosome-binding factor A